MADDRFPPDILWDQPLVSGRLLECEVWNRINAHQLQNSHGDAVRNLIGRVAMIEPAMTAVARRFYRHCHEKPVEMDVDPFAPVVTNPNRDPFEANQAIPTLLFATPAACSRVENMVPSLRVRRVDWLSLVAYPMSGGFRSWSLVPAVLVSPILALEERIPAIVRRRLAFRIMVVLERV